MKNQTLRLAVYVITFATAFITSATQDYLGFLKQKEGDDSLKFDFSVALPKWARAAILSVVGAGSLDTLIGHNEG